MHLNLNKFLASAVLLSLPLTSFSRAVPQSPNLSCVENVCPSALIDFDVDGGKRIDDKLHRDGAFAHHHNDTEQGKHTHEAKVIIVPRIEVPDIPEVPDVPEPAAPEPADPESPSNPISLISAADPNAPKATDDPSQPIKLSSEGAPAAPQPTDDPSQPIHLSSAGAPAPPKPTDDPSQPIHLSSAEAPAPPKPTVAPSAPAPGPSAASAAPPKATGAESAPPAAPAPASSNPKDQPIPPECILKRSADGLSVRSDCNPGISGDGDADGGGFASDPAGAQQIAPNINRDAVKNWYDVIDTPNVPPQQARATLATRIKSGAADLIPGTSNEYKAPEVADGVETFGGDRDIAEEIFTENGVTDISKSGRHNVLFLQNPETKLKGKNVQENTFSDDGKLIAADWSMGRDTNGQPLGNLRWDDLVFQQYRDYMSSKGLDTTRLEHVARVDVVNSATLTTLKQAYEETGFVNGLDKVATFRLITDNQAEERAFDALSRSDNVNGVYWLLSDFHNALGNKEVTAIYTKLNIGGDSATIVMDIGPVSV